MTGFLDVLRGAVTAVSTVPADLAAARAAAPARARTASRWPSCGPSTSKLRVVRSYCRATAIASSSTCPLGTPWPAK